MNPNRFHRLMIRLGAYKESGELFSNLSTRYSEPHRAYHNSIHIHDCLIQLDTSGITLHNTDAVEAAIWFHDVIYDTHRSDNEEMSSAWAAENLAILGVNSRIIQVIQTLILSTKHGHPSGIHNPDEQLLMDIDLSILGRSWDVFEKYDLAIREEYHWVDDFTFRQARAKILQGFLDRKSIFQTPSFQGRYEASARKNLQKAITLLNEHQS